jgi:hypothetical protein
MNRFLVALALVVLPAVASAAPQTVRLEYFASYGDWEVLDSSTPIMDRENPPLFVQAFAWTLTKQAADGLAALSAVDGKQYRCKATAFFVESDSFGAHIGYRL